MPTRAFLAGHIDSQSWFEPLSPGDRLPTGAEIAGPIKLEVKLRPSLLRK